MPVVGQTDTRASLELKTSVELKPLELSLIPSGKIVISLPGLKIRLPEIKIKLLFLPFLSISGLEITTEPAKLEINLSDITIQTKIEKITQLQVITSGEIKANAALEGAGAMTTGPLKLEA
ncbi:MAG TPA: hypothetical protein ACFYD3_03335 [Candidatus Hypogeohydataceae bacterium YC41]